jgi:membrane-bound lytic murein transglycosylase MltF
VISSDGGESVTSDVPDSILNIDHEDFKGDLGEIHKRRLLRVLVTHSRTDFFLDQGGIHGLQAEAVRKFVEQLNGGIRRESDKLFVQFIPVQFHELIPSLVSGKGDVAAAFLTITPERKKLVDIVGGGSLSVNEVLVSSKKSPAISSLNQLSGKDIYVLKGSTYVEHLNKLNEELSIAGLAKIIITEADDRLLTEDILELVNAGIIDYTISDDFKAELWSKVLPNLVIHDDIQVSSNKKLGWAIRKNSLIMSEALETFFKQARKGTLFGNVLFNRYFKDTKWISNPLEQERRDRFNQVAHLFEKYANQYQFDPLALVAQAYQESKLDHNTRSSRGAVGIMQLLPSTANDKNVAISDIDKLENNIHAGAKYLNFLRKRYFSGADIDPLNQRLLTWAAYNAGPNSIARVRSDALKQGLDPNVWFGNVEVMAARKISREPVKYVANIYKYYTAYLLLQRRSQERHRALEDQVERM